MPRSDGPKGRLPSRFALLALGGAPVGIILLDRSGRLLFANPRARSLLALGAEANESDLPAELRGIAGWSGPATGLRIQAAAPSGDRLVLTAGFGRLGPPEGGFVVALDEITEQAWVEDALQLSMDRLHVLHEMDGATLSLDLPRVARLALSGIRTLIDGSQGAVHLFSRRSGLGRILGTGDDPGELLPSPSGDRLPPKSTRYPLAGLEPFLEALERGSPLVRDAGIPLDPAFSCLPRQWTQGARSLMAVPLMVRGALSGCLLVSSPLARGFSEADMGIAREVADGLAGSIANARLVSSLRRERRRLTGLARRLELVQEEERRRLSRELHDRVGGSLAMLGIRIGLAADLAGRGEPGEAVGHLTAAQELLARTSESVRDVMAELRPPVLDDLGLLPALEWLGRRQSQGNGALVRVDGDRSAPRLDRDTELTLLRIAEEAITNAITHAHAGSVEVSLARSPGRVRLTISDDGVGFDPAGPKAPGAEGHWGLTIMHERALAIGGTLAVDSRAGGGTRVTVVVPEAARGG